MTRFYKVLWIAAAIGLGLTIPLYVFYDEVSQAPPLTNPDFIR